MASSARCSFLPMAAVLLVLLAVASAAPSPAKTGDEAPHDHLDTQQHRDLLDADGRVPRVEVAAHTLLPSKQDARASVLEMIQKLSQYNHPAASMEKTAIQTISPLAVSLGKKTALEAIKKLCRYELGVTTTQAAN